VTAVLDASAVLALLFGEPGADTVVDHIAAGAAISTVNLAEVATVLVRNGRNPNSVLDPLRSQVDVVAFTDADAITTAELYPLVSTRGLSLGDRACLALARRLDATAVTAEHLWAELDLTIRIDTIRARQRDDAG
jgi:ribonuclease VapC